MTWEMVTALAIICATILLALIIVFEPVLLLPLTIVAFFAWMWFG